MLDPGDKRDLFDILDSHAYHHFAKNGETPEEALTRIGDLLAAIALIALSETELAEDYMEYHMAIRNRASQRQ